MPEPDREARDREPPKCDTLFAGPWYGEFGHELFWQGIVRHRSHGYARTVVCSKPSSAALYKDFADEFIPHDIVCEGMVAGSTSATRPDAKKVLSYVPEDAQRWHGCEYTPAFKAEFVRYGVPDPAYMGCVVLHARNRRHVPARNWPQDQWNRLARWLIREGIADRLVCLGTQNEALAVEGACDMRGAALDQQMNVLASALFAVGPSSGGMHLASLCGCPHVVWCGGAATEWRRTKGRYDTTWNPHKTLVHAHPHASWQPPFATAQKWVREFLKVVYARKVR